MSRSRRKKPICGVTTATSEKEEKRMYNRAIRRKNRQLIISENTDLPFVGKREVIDIWSMEKDGKTRFDPIKHKDLMRK